MFRPLVDVSAPAVVVETREAEVPLEEITMADLPGEPAEAEPEMEAVPEPEEPVEEPLTIEDLEVPPEAPEIEPVLELLPERKKPERPPESKVERRPRQDERASRLKPRPPVSAPGGTGAGGSGGTARTGRGGGGKFPQPNYPSFARARGLSGTVMLRISVNPDGTVASVSVVRSTGSRELDEHAAGFVRRRWRWPEGGSRRFQLPVNFRLR